MDLRIIAIGFILLAYSFLELVIGKAFVPSWPFFPDTGHVSREKHKLIFWPVVMVKVLLAAALILGAYTKA